MTFFNYIKNSFKLYFSNLESYEFIDKKITWQKAFLYTIFFSFISSLISIIIKSFFEFNSKIFVKLFISILLESVIYLPIFLIIFFGFYHFLFKLFDGKADFYQTLKFGLSASIFSTFILVLIYIIPLELLSKRVISILEIIITILGLVFLIWMYVILIRFYSKIHMLSNFKVALILLLPLLIMFILGIFIFFILFIFGYATF